MSARAGDNQRLLRLKTVLVGVRLPKVYDDMIDLNETYNENRIQRLMQKKTSKRRLVINSSVI